MADEPGDGDVVELGGRELRLPGWLSSRLPGGRPPRGASVLALAALVVGLAAGYAAGNRHALAGPTPPRPAVTASAPSSGSPFQRASSPALYQDAGGCSAQAGRQLQLGVRVTNQSQAPVLLASARAVLPLGGLKQLTWRWGPCGALPGPDGQARLILAAGDSTWLTVTLSVRVHCPGPLPVQFSVGYQLLPGHPVTASLPGFPDLGQVPYAGCPPPAATSGAPSIAMINWPASR